jgi:hypothetical protein
MTHPEAGVISVIACFAPHYDITVMNEVGSELFIIITYDPQSALLTRRGRG